MSYDYETEKPKILTAEGQKMLFKIRQQAADLINKAGCVRLEKAIGNISGDSWLQIACLDYLVELGEFTIILKGDIPAQHWIYGRRA